MTVFDVIVIGGGIAGASAAYELAHRRRVLVLEREAQPGYHSTGRSAALFLTAYGSPTVRGLTVATEPFLRDPPPGFVEHPILTPRGVLVVARADQMDSFARVVADARPFAPGAYEIAPDEALRLVPVLRRDYVAAAFLLPDATDIDVAGLHHGYLRGLRARGEQVLCDAEVQRIEAAGGLWTVTTRAGRFAAPIVVDAAGAWADEIARLAGVRPVGLVPKRRTAITIEAPAGHDIDRWPLVDDADEQFYFKPDAGRLLASPADETPLPPQDVQPDELDIAICVDRIEKAANLGVKRILGSWAGLRSFVADGTMVVGFAPDAPGFFWLAGQGGYGIQTSAALARITAAMVEGADLPDDIRAHGVREAALSPARLHTSTG